MEMGQCRANCEGTGGTDHPFPAVARLQKEEIE
jgi:hypothetical protein